MIIATATMCVVFYSTTQEKPKDVNLQIFMVAMIVFNITTSVATINSVFFKNKLKCR